MVIIDFFPPKMKELEFVVFIGFGELRICPPPLDLAGDQGRGKPLQKTAIKREEAERSTKKHSSMK